MRNSTPKENEIRLVGLMQTPWVGVNGGTIVPGLPRRFKAQTRVPPRLTAKTLALPVERAMYAFAESSDGLSEDVRERSSEVACACRMLYVPGRHVSA
jgi:hypothetical protein